MGQTNFDETLPEAVKKQAVLAVKDEYTFDFMDLADEHSERDIIVLDEPTSGLDLTHMREVAGAITRLLSLGKTVFIITHDRELATAVCSRAIRMERGKIADTWFFDWRKVVC